VRNWLGDLHPFLAERSALSEPALLGMTGGEEGQGLHRGHTDLTEALATLCTLEGGHGLPETSDRSPMVTLGPIYRTKVEACQGMRDGIPDSGCQRQGALGGGDRLVIRPHVAEIS
jgi:hypothetical protein